MFKYSHKKYINFAGIFAFAFSILALFLLEKYPGIFPGSAFVYYETLKAKMGSVSSQSTLGKVYFYDLDPDYSRAFYWWSVAAKNGDDNAACELGREYFSGKYIQKDLKKSFDLYNSASETCGIYGLYKFYESGVVVDKDVKKSLSILEGIKSRQTNDFSKYMDNAGLGEDLEVALERNKIELGIENGDGDSLFKKGKMYDDDGSEGLDYSQAISWYRKAAEKDNHDAINRLWEIYYYGVADGIVDYKSALPYLESAAEKGYTEALKKLARMYFDGNGVEKNYIKSAEYYQSAADRGDSDSQYLLGMMLLMGDEYLPKDEERAFGLVKDAADRGDGDAQYYLYTMLDKGVGTAKDQKAAIEYLEKSAYSGIAQGQLILGILRSAGRGTRKDIIDGYMWLNMASDNGDLNAAKFRDMAEASMSKDQISEAQIRQKKLSVTRSESSVNPSVGPVDESSPQAEKSPGIKLVKHAGVFAVPVLLNNVLTINFIVDSGTADVMISSDVASTLLKTGTILESDFLPDAIYTIADGSQSSSKRFKIRSMKIGPHEITNVTCAVANQQNAPMLLGQSALQKMGSYRIDYEKGIIIFD